MGILAIDDRDPLLSYSPISAWSPGGVANEYNSTTSYTSITGSTVKLTFTGTTVSVFGTINPNSLDGPPSSSYSIDNGSPTLFSGMQTSDVQYQQRFFSSGSLTPTAHTLLITVLSRNSTYFLDYITVLLPDPGDTLSSSSSSSFSSSSSKSLPGSSSTLTHTPTTRPSTTGSSTSSSASQTPSSSPVNAYNASTVGFVVGGVIGGIALIIVAILAMLFVRKRRREKNFESRFDPRNQSLWTRYTPSNSQLTPFITSRYHPIDNNQFGLVDNPRMAPHVVDPFTSSHVPDPAPRNDPYLSSSSKPAFSRHAASPSQHSLLSQIAPNDSSSSQGASGSARGVTPSAPSVRTDINELPPPPQYDY